MDSVTIFYSQENGGIIANMNEEKLSAIRHSLAHLLATAVLEKYPDTKLAIGPVIENGFYYDFEFPAGVSITPEDLKEFQKRMKKLTNKEEPFVGREISLKEAREMFAGQPYKLELIDEFSKEGQTLTAYTNGNFVDLCRGGHVNSTKELNPDAFALTHTAGAYWRGNEKNKMLTRIYGLAFETREELDAYIAHQEEAKKRDHRKLGRELDLFTFSDLVGPGLPLFTPKGTAMRDAIIEKIHGMQKKFGYHNVSIPHITKKELYETSGHWEKFGDELFKVKGASDTEFVMKPMNCPHHTQIYASRPRSYRDLPIRYTEATAVYRDEQAGELLGLSRVRSITQDDGHIFCTIDQIEQETENIISVIREFYESLGMWSTEGSWVSLSVRDLETPEKYLGDSTHWDMAEEILEKVAQNESVPYKRVSGEAAFYGPKLDFMFKDALGRERQLATIQLDFVMPTRFSLEYTDEQGKRQTPVMIHRAIAGSLERFLAVIIEHFAGAFPLWLSPLQVKVLSIGAAHKEYAAKVCAALRETDIRAELDDSDETLGKKIRNVKLEKVPYFIVIGDQEMADEQITVESRDQRKIGMMTVDEFIRNMKAEIAGKSKQW
ncbi:MAG: threonine--tRNA ligase [Patescibacteria group bacterium]|nr:threonine--tRNA ligase [Patescibacteria group bacterium]